MLLSRASIWEEVMIMMSDPKSVSFELIEQMQRNVSNIYGVKNGTANPLPLNILVPNVQ